MPLPGDLFKSRFRRCGHVHLSGRRCGMQITPPKEKGAKVLCQFHKGPCVECGQMRVAFIPPKGW